MSRISYLKHPKGLYLLFFTEFWERFGFYTLQTIIILYMTKGLMFSDDKAYLLYGAFSALLYLTPVVGGYLADRILGFRHSIYVGGVLFVLGYILTALPQHSYFYLGLSAVIMANGFFKPSVSSIVGELYEPNDLRRESGYTIFYMGINVGSLIPPLITGALVAHFGWHWGFLLAAIGMGGGIVNFFLGQKRLGKAGDVPANSPLRKNSTLRKIFYPLLFLAIFFVIFLMHFIFYFPRQADVLLVVATGIIIFSIMNLWLKENPNQQRKMIACNILIAIATVFWAFYSQMFTSLMLFADRNMSKQFLGLTIDAEFTQFFNSFFILVLSPLLSWFWIWLDRKKNNPSTPMKFSLGVLFLSFSFIFLSGAVAFFSHKDLISPWWIVMSYCLLTIGELLLSPIGLAMITRLSPQHLVGMMMGVWFLSQSIGFVMGSLFSMLAAVPKDVSIEISMSIYAHAFGVFGLISMIVAMASMLLVPLLKRLIHDPN